MRRTFGEPLPDRQWRQHGAAFIFRWPISRRERRCTCGVCALIAAALAVIALVLFEGPVDEEHERWGRLALVAMLMPAIFAALAMLAPQRSIRVSPRGLWIARTFPRKRLHVRWSEVSAVRPNLSALRVGGRVFALQQVPVWGSQSKSAAVALRAAMRAQLETSIDFSTPSAYQRWLAGVSRPWTWRWLVDRMALLAVALLFTGMSLAKCFCCCRPILAFGMLAACGGPLVVWFVRFIRRESRDNWLHRV